MKIQSIIVTALLSASTHLATSQWNNATNQGDIHYSSGNVGIGTSNPQFSLDIVNNLLTLNKIRIANAVTGSAYNDGLVLGLENKTVSFYNLERGGFRFFTGDDQLGNNSEKMIIKANGNVGVGTSAPNAKLHIVGDLINDGNIQLNGGLSTTGNVGIGVSNPTSALEVSGRISAQNLQITNGASSGKVLTSDANGNGSWQALPPSSTSVWSAGPNGSATITNGTQTLKIAPNGNIDVISNGPDPKIVLGYNNGNPNVKQIHLMASDYIYTEAELRIHNKIKSDEVQVLPPGWSDYVFDQEYELMPLEEVQEYIEENHHLPNIPSAKEVEANGINLGEMNALLLAKIEELTLHVIKQEEKIDFLLQNLGAQEIQEHKEKKD